MLKEANLSGESLGYTALRQLVVRSLKAAGVNITNNNDDAIIDTIILLLEDGCDESVISDSFQDAYGANIAKAAMKTLQAELAKEGVPKAKDNVPVVQITPSVQKTQETITKKCSIYNSTTVRLATLLVIKGAVKNV
ncbi:MAG: hypothetical protein EZS28_028734 [Streblomastix strix]|uniref:Uncharacterized protein n=1 Tax=Streblomastix strix TaxID=222440 RepID=A0A5J4V076_9EUKA|nr:MAG: hypothetical protein EZS28_028734 [Streblomastix strix]